MVAAHIGVAVGVHMDRMSGLYDGISGFFHRFAKPPTPVQQIRQTGPSDPVGDPRLLRDLVFRFYVSDAARSVPFMHPLQLMPCPPWRGVITERRNHHGAFASQAAQGLPAL